MKDLKVGEATTYCGYEIRLVEPTEYQVAIHHETLGDAKEWLRTAMKAGLIDTPQQFAKFMRGYRKGNKAEATTGGEEK